MLNSTGFLRKINPRNTLFGRILIWFWVTVTVMVILAFMVARFMNQSWQVSAMTEEQVTRATSLRTSLQRQLNRAVPLKRALQRMSTRGRWNIMTINQQTNEFTLGFPPPLLSQRSKLLALKDSQSPLVIRTNNIEFYGPFVINVEAQTHSMFIGRLLRREEQAKFAISGAFIVFFSVGIMACIGIAYTIAKPIRQLSELSQDFAAGNICKANKTLSRRQDEIGQLHNDIFDMASNLAKSVSQQKALMANVSHELRTPLTRLHLALTMLNPQSDEQKHYAARIEKDIEIMDTLIGQSLQLARMNDDSQAQWLQFTSCGLKQVLAPILTDLKFEAQANNKQIEINEFEDVQINLIENNFASAVENVTRNALKYANSVVNIQISITSVGEEKRLVIRVDDDGIGISEQELPHVLEPFYRVQSSRQKNGIGLGLSIVKAAVELHDGSIDLSASSHGGLCVTLSFPFAHS